MINPPENSPVATYVKALQSPTLTADSFPPQKTWSIAATLGLCIFKVKRSNSYL